MCQTDYFTDVKTLFKNKWVEVRKSSEGYVYTHLPNCQGRKIGILPFTIKRFGLINEVLARFERNTAHSPHRSMSYITGGVEAGEDPLAAAARELFEEGGYGIPKNEVIPLGWIHPSKYEDTKMWLFAWNATGRKGLKVSQPPGDGTEGEADEFSDWVSVDNMWESKDGVPLVILMRLLKAKPDLSL